MIDSDQAMLVLTVPPRLEDEVIDWLLSRPETTGFTSLPASGHGGGQHQLSTAEKVRGKQARTQFQVALPHAAIAETLREFHVKFANSGYHAWAIPLLALPRIDDE